MNVSDIEIPVSMMGEPEHILDRYRQYIMEGVQPGMATILASRKAPRADTDTAHYAGTTRMEAAWGTEYTRLRRQEAIRAGFKPSDSAVFNPTFCDGRRGGDPMAWMEVGDGRGKFKKVCDMRGIECEDLGVKANGKSLELTAQKEARVKKRVERMKQRQAAKAEFLRKG